MKKFMEPAIEMEAFSVEDVITTSDLGDNELEEF